MKLAGIAIVFVLLARLASAACLVNATAADEAYAQVCGVDAFTDCSNDAKIFIALAFALVSFAIALAFMYGKIKEDQAITLWAKDEAANLVISALLFAGLLAFFTASCNLAASYFPRQNPFEAADSYLGKLLSAQGTNILRQLTYDSLTNQYDATYYMYEGIIPFKGSGVAERANLRALSAHKEFVIDMYLPMIASLTAQKYILQAMQWVAASVLLPFAFVMRLIPPTREFGNILIAIFFAMYIVVPTMYALGGQAFDQITASPTCISCAGGSSHNFYSYGLDGGTKDSKVWKEALLYRIGSTIPQAVFLPNIVIIVAVTCAMSISKALRGLAV